MNALRRLLSTRNATTYAMPMIPLGVFKTTNSGNSDCDCHCHCDCTRGDCDCDNCNCDNCNCDCNL